MDVNYYTDSEDDFPPAKRQGGGPVPAIYPVTFPDGHVDSDAVKVIKRLNRAGYEAYLVGGGVRDLLLGCKPKDFDVATSARPTDVRRLFRNCRVIGRRFRLAHVLFAGGKIIEVATFRRDPGQEYRTLDYAEWPEGALQDGDRPVRLIPLHGEVHEDEDLLIRNDNVFGMPHEDSIRRDFTVNGLFFDLARGEVIDYVGGMPDVFRRRLRTIGESGIRFKEDPIRILRSIKFSARLDMGIAPEVYEAMVDHRKELSRAARPRLFEELLRLLRGGAAHRSMYLAWDVGALAELLPEVASFLDDDAPGAEATWGRLRAIDALQAQGACPDDALLVTALILGPLEEELDGARAPDKIFEEFMDKIVARLALPRKMKDRIRLLVACQRRLRTGKVGSLAKREFFADAALLYSLDLEAKGEPVPDWTRRPRTAAPVLGEDPEVVSDDEPRRRRRRRRQRSPA